MTNDETGPLGLGSKLGSGVPLELSRPRYLRVMPAKLVNSPPTKILPSVCGTMHLTIESGSGRNESVIARFTLKATTELVVRPKTFVTTTSYVALSLHCTFVKLREASVAA